MRAGAGRVAELRKQVAVVYALSSHGLDGKMRSQPALDWFPTIAGLTAGFRETFAATTFIFGVSS